MLLQHCWGPVWSQRRSWTWSMVRPAQKLSFPEACCLPTKVDLLLAIFPALFRGRWKERRRDDNSYVLTGPNLVLSAVPPGAPNHWYLSLGESTWLQPRVFSVLFLLGATLCVKS